MSLAHRGTALEALLDRVHASYVRAGHVAIRLGPPTRSAGQIRGEPVFRAIGPAPPDYLVSALGRVYLFEAKSTEAARWPLDLLEVHQAHALDAWERQGGAHVAGVVLGLRGVQVVYWLPWQTLGPRWWAHHLLMGRAAPGTASLDETDARLLGELCVGGDWLDAARRAP